MENPENTREILESVEKPKKKLSEAQLKNLEKMRHKKSIKAEAKKMIKKEPKENINITPSNFVGSNASPDYSDQFLKLSDDLQYIKDYIKSKKELKEQKKKKDNTIDIKSNEEEDEKYKYLMYQQHLRSNFLR